MKRTLFAVVSGLLLETASASGGKPYTHQNFVDDPTDFRFAIIPDRYGADSDGKDYRDGFMKAVKAVNLLRPEFVMSIGDLVPWSHLAASAIRPLYAAADADHRKIAAPFYWVPGNHDIAIDLDLPTAHFPHASETSLKVWQEFNGDPYYSFVYKGCLFLALNTIDRVTLKSTHKNITEEQYRWAQETLEKNRDVRWTCVFMHEPLTWRTERWQRFEREFLVKRKYTVFAGDWHTYSYFRRHGRDYYVLAVAGGAGGGGVAGRDFKARGRLMGRDYGEIEHIMWVTMTKEGPKVANIEVDHVLSGDFLTQGKSLSMGGEFLASELDVPKVPGTGRHLADLRRRKQDVLKSRAPEPVVNYYADPLFGDDANDGRSRAKAFRTLTRATKDLKAGDVLNLAEGAVFNESLVFRSSGEPGRPIVVRGNNAVVDGAYPLDGAKWEPKGKDLWFQPSEVCWGALRPRVYLGDDVLTRIYTHPNQVNPEKLEPKMAVWRPEGVYFRAEAGKKPSDYALLGGSGRNRGEHSGVIIENRSYITVENVIAQRFPNDGFNVHGTCRGLVFRGIVARQNGDDGFSIHDDVMAVVEGLHSFGNDFGVEDVGTAQTVVSGALIETNRLSGFSAYGGLRILRDATVRDNGGRQLSARPSRVGDRIPTPMYEATVYFENVTVEGGDEAMGVEAGATVTAKGCRFADSKRGFRFTGGRVHLEKCTVENLGSAPSVSPECRLTTSECRGLK